MSDWFDRMTEEDINDISSDEIDNTEEIVNNSNTKQYHDWLISNNYRYLFLCAFDIGYYILNKTSSSKEWKECVERIKRRIDRSLKLIRHTPIRVSFIDESASFKSNIDNSGIKTGWLPNIKTRENPLLIKSFLNHTCTLYFNVAIGESPSTIQEALQIFGILYGIFETERQRYNGHDGLFEITLYTPQNPSGDGDVEEFFEVNHGRHSVLPLNPYHLLVNKVIGDMGFEREILWKSKFIPQQYLETYTEDKTYMKFREDFDNTIKRAEEIRKKFK